MQLGSKHEPEASFSFQINDAVKGDEEYLLAEDDFLRDVNDYTLTTPAPLPRTTVLEHGQPITRGHLRTEVDNCGPASASSPPKPFAPSSPARANVRHHEVAVTRRLKTPKATSTFPSKLSTPRTTMVTRSTARWPLPSREINLPRPEASPAVARLETLRAEIEMLGDGDGLSDDCVQQYQEGHSSDKRAESGNDSLLNSDMPTPTKLESTRPIEEEALMGENEPGSGIYVMTRSIPADEPQSLSSSDDNGKPVSPDIDENAENTAEQPDIMNSQNLIGAIPDEDGNFDKNEALNITEAVPKKDQEGGTVAPLTLSQLSPWKSVTSANLDDRGPIPGSSSAVLMSPMRQPRKRPASAVATDTRDGQSKKGKTVSRTTHTRGITPKGPGAVNSSRSIRRKNTTPKADVKSQGSMVRRRISSGSRLKSSQLSSSAVGAVPSTSLASSSGLNQSQRSTRAQANRLLEPAQTMEVVERKQKRVMVEKRFEAEDDDPFLPVLEDSTLASQGQEVTDQLNITSKSRHSGLGVVGDNNHNNDVTDHLTHQGTTSHVNATKPADFQFQFRLEGRTQTHPFQERPGPRLRSQTRGKNPPSASLLKTSKSAMASSSLSNSRSIASMTRSQFKYVHYRPPPDFKAQHSLLESSRARRKENVAPTLPVAFELHTDARARERERFNETVKEKEKEMELEREAKRREREEQEEQEVRELRRRAVPRAHVVPEWYKDAPRRKGKAGS